MICGCATETPKFGLRPRCMVSTHFPFDSYSCKYTCQKGYRLEGRNMRYCQIGQTWDSMLPRCVRIETTATPSRAISPDTRISPDIVCKLPEDPIQCGFNITTREACESEGCCFNPGGLPDGGFCYFAECEEEYNQCLNGGRCIQTQWPRQFDCVCKGYWAGRYCQYQPKWTCGRSSWTPQAPTGTSDQRNIFIKMWQNRDRGRRAIAGPDSDLGMPSLKGISNQHLIQILEAGRNKKDPVEDLERMQISINPQVARIEAGRVSQQAEDDSERVRISIGPQVQPHLVGHNGKMAANTRIVGGSRVESQQHWPWVVMIKQNWKYICAGVLIAPQWVLTAAHCGFEKNIKNNTAPGPSWKVVAGESSQFSLLNLIFFFDFNTF